MHILIFNRKLVFDLTASLKAFCSNILLLIFLRWNMQPVFELPFVMMFTIRTT